jgi:hypothetical protein
MTWSGLGQPLPSARTLRAMEMNCTHSAICAAGLFLLAGLVTHANATDAGSGAASYLEFESVLDGHCQNLSPGGKLRIVHNVHPDSAIDFRLFRIFVGKRQGRSTGIAQPRGTPVKLGCTRVDGREQDWIVERARFAAADV